MTTRCSTGTYDDACTQLEGNPELAAAPLSLEGTGRATVWHPEPGPEGHLMDLDFRPSGGGESYAGGDHAPTEAEQAEPWIVFPRAVLRGDAEALRRARDAGGRERPTPVYSEAEWPQLFARGLQAPNDELAPGAVDPAEETLPGLFAAPTVPERVALHLPAGVEELLASADAAPVDAPDVPPLVDCCRFCSHPGELVTQSGFLVCADPVRCREQMLQMAEAVAEP